MFPKTLIALSLAVSGMCAYSQGELYFNTFFQSTWDGPYGAPIYGPDPSNPHEQRNGQGSANLSAPVGPVDYSGHTPLAGSGFTAQLWGGLDASGLQPPNPGTGTRGFSTVPQLAGHLSTGVAAQYHHPAGTILTLQVRAWDNQNGTITSWAQVLANPSVARGWSATFLSQPLTVAPWTPHATPGITSFNLVGVLMPVPEPSVFAFGALAASALFWRRRRTPGP